MSKLLMITGDRALAEGKRGAFYNTLEEFHKYWERVDIITPKIPNSKFAYSAEVAASATKAGQIPNSRGSTSNLQEVEPLSGKPLFGNVYIHSSPWPLWLQPWWILKKGHEIYREQKFDLMTVHEYPPFYNGIGARLLWNKICVPYVLEIHHIPGHPKAADLKEWIYKTAVRCFIKYDSAKAKAVRIVNQKQVPEFLIRAGVPESKIVYIPSMYIDLDVFKPTDPIRGRARASAPEGPTGRATSNGVNAEKKYDLIFIGRLAKNKGVDLLIDAFKILTYNLKPTICNLVIVGDGPLREWLRFRVKSLKLQNNVIFHGWAKDSAEVACLLNQSKVLVMPSYNEGGPRVVLEAMACGVPVLATPVGIVPDIIGDGEPHTKWGRATSPRDFVRGGSGGIINWDPADIFQKALELLGNEEKYQKYRENGLKIARNFEKRAAIQNYAQKLISLSR